MAEVMTKTAARCPDLETIAAYLDGRLSDRERARVTAHLAECEECYALFRESAQTLVEEAGRIVAMRTWRERLPRARVLWPAAAAVMATAAAVWLVVGAGPTRILPSSDPHFQKLVAAVASNRTVEGRMTGGFAYGSFRGRIRSAEPSSASIPPASTRSRKPSSNSKSQRNALPERSSHLALPISSPEMRAVR